MEPIPGRSPNDAGVGQLPNQRLKLSARGGRAVGDNLFLIAAAR